MDIVTHAAIGITLAGTALSHPMLALGLLTGSVLPDVDVVARVFGSRIMMLNHQTFSHSLPVLLLVSIISSWIPGLDRELAAGLFAGAALHVAMDYTNTLGVTLLWPFVRRRLHLGWVFFVDGFVLVVAVAGAAMVLNQVYSGGSADSDAAVMVFVFLAGYWMLKGALKRLAANRAGAGAVSVVPSALLPWIFLVCSRHGNKVSVSRLNVLTNETQVIESHQIHDAEVGELLEPLLEWQLMRGLSTAYHVILCQPCGAGMLVRCRDLRIRNFNTRFGDLELRLGHDGTILESTFHV